MAVDVKCWRSRLPTVEEARPARCPVCGAASRPAGKALAIHGHGLHERQLRGPSELSFLIQHNRASYYDTLRKLHALHQSGHADIRLTHQDGADYVPLVPA